MQPAALSVEPLIIISGMIFVFGILPVAIWIAYKAKPEWRAVAAGVGLIALVALSFNLGKMTGLSMAWYHWRSEYKEPLQELQIHVQNKLESGNTNGVIKMMRLFSNEDLQSYGREKLLTRGRFRNFVDEALRKAP